MPKINQPASKIRMSFDEWFPVAQKYYQKHKNLLVPLDYETKDGKKLGKWIASKRKDYANNLLSLEKIKALDSIGMVWTNKINHDISKYLRKLKESDNPIIIDEKINADILNNISLIELESKIKYITDMGALPIDNTGRLIDIFTISNTDMEERYGISLEAMIESFEVSSARKLYY